MRPLGNLRCRILACLGADNPKLPAFFDPPQNGPMLESLHRHLLKLQQEFAADPDSRRIVAAGLLSLGELARADEILSRFPLHPVAMDHGAGWCPLVAYSAVSELLPLPEELRDARGWVEGSATASGLMQWFHSNYNRLCWDSGSGRFVLNAPASNS
jgi:hypothetical protein